MVGVLTQKWCLLVENESEEGAMGLGVQAPLTDDGWKLTGEGREGKV